MARGLSLVSIGLLLVGIAVSVLWIVLTGGADSFAALARVGPAWVLPLAGVTVFCIAVRFVRWQFLLRRADVRLPARPSLGAYLASLAGTATPAYVGEAIRCVLLRRKLGAPVRTTLSVLVFERLLDVAALGSIGVATATSWRSAALPAALGAGALGVGVAAASFARRSAFPLGSVAELRHPRVVAPALALSLAAWLPASASVALAAAALGRGDEVGLLDGMRVFATATLAGGVTLMPAGLGATGTAAVLALEGLGLPPVDALPVVALFRLTTTGFALSVGAVFVVLEIRGLRRRAPAAAPEHFDEIAQHYQGQYSPHMWKLLLERKVGILASPLPPPARAGIGLDMGCGLGHQCVAMGERGFRVVGLDASQQLLLGARAAGAAVVRGDARTLPFPDGTFDFVYAVGMLHHLPDSAAQAAACREASRVLKPGGSLLVHETNTRNPLFRFYMGYVFPILKTIDEGTERWIEPSRWSALDGMELVQLRYFTFLPDTIPRPLLRPFLALERKLEASRVASYAVHYMAHLRKPSR